MQRQPAALLDHLARRFVLAQELSLIDADTVDHLAAVTRHHMKQVAYHLGLRAMPLRLKIESRRLRLDPLAVFA